MLILGHKKPTHESGVYLSLLKADYVFIVNSSSGTCKTFLISAINIYFLIL